VHETVFAAMFGASRWGYPDAFPAAFQIPNLLRDLFAEGALSTAFTAVFTKMHEREGDQPAWRLANLPDAFSPTSPDTGLSFGRAVPTPN
jgi:putative peptidoglycan lipid II flippase